ncbi:MAG: type II toxin-antitoxin system RelE/ParE family toxin [Bacteroidota bacterium]|nr:type II toxin-antitoxin system RelE/ParE family toxin [Bacteroidota bacterium]
MNQLKVRTVFAYKTYFSDFYDRQQLKVRDKILWTFRIIEYVQHVPEEYLKHLKGTEGLYELRIQQGSDIFRIFCFFDEGQLVVLANGYQKKTQRTPKAEIEKALRIKKQYEQEK